MKYLILLLSILHLALSTSYADTTWVSGAVSGEWTREGNPYIVVDSTWVPVDEWLVLNPGIEMYFNEGTGLNLFGGLNVTGSEDEPISLRMSEGVEHWRGIRYFGWNLSIWQNCTLVCPDTAILLDRSYELTMVNCSVDADSAFIAENPDGEQHISGWDFDLTNCSFIGGSYLTMRGGELVASHCRFDFGRGWTIPPGFFGDGTNYTLNNCEVIGGLYNDWEGNNIIDSCRFLRPPSGEDVRVYVIGMRGHIRDSYVEGQVILGPTSRVWIPCERNVILGYVSNDACYSTITDCEIFGFVRLRGNIRMLRNIFHRYVLIRGDDIVIDSCSFLAEDNREALRVGSDQDEQRSRVRITRSLLLNTLGFSVFQLGNVTVDHCTQIVDSSDFSLEFRSDPNIPREHFRFSNNVFYATTRSDGFLFHLNREYWPIMEYNCFFGFDFAVNDEVDPEALDSLGPLNLFIDPMLDIENEFGLLENSPCIDAGDPDAPPDPDGTRSDIGAHYFHQNDEVLLEGTIPSAFELTAFPNPFNSTLTIRYATGGLETAATRLTIYDIDGREVASFPPLLAGGELKGGAETLVWDASAAPAGVYFVRLQAGGEVSTKKVVLMR